MKALFPLTVFLFFALVALAQKTTQLPGKDSASASRPRFFRLPSGDTLKQYYFVMLTKGPRRAEVTDTAIINKIQQGHMDNMDRLAKIGKLKVAGPFGDDGDWRGIFILDCDTQKEAEELLATDPAIKAGRLSYEIHPWWTQQGTVIR
jgi:uncharacterized protein